MFFFFFIYFSECLFMLLNNQFIIHPNLPIQISSLNGLELGKMAALLWKLSTKPRWNRKVENCGKFFFHIQIWAIEIFLFFFERKLCKFYLNLRFFFFHQQFSTGKFSSFAHQSHSFGSRIEIQFLNCQWNRYESLRWI